MNEFFLQGLKVVERTAGPFEQERKLGSEQALPPEDHDAHHDHGEKTHGDAEGLHRRRKRRVKFGMHGGPEEAEQGEHAQARDPDAQHGPRRLGVRQVEAQGEQRNCSHPGDGNGQWDVVETAAVIEFVFDGPVCNIGTGGVERARAEQLAVQLTPSSASGMSEVSKRTEEDKLFRQIGKVEIDAVGRLVHLYGLPGNDGVYIDEDPPREQKGEVEHADAFVALIFPEMRKHGEGRDHGHQMQE